MTPEEVRTMLKERDERKREKLQAARDKILSQVDSGETVLAPQIGQEDIDFLATTQVKFS